MTENRDQIRLEKLMKLIDVRRYEQSEEISGLVRKFWDLAESYSNLVVLAALLEFSEKLLCDYLDHMNREVEKRKVQ